MPKSKLYINRKNLSYKCDYVSFEEAFRHFTLVVVSNAFLFINVFASFLFLSVSLSLSLILKSSQASQPATSTLIHQFYFGLSFVPNQQRKVEIRSFSMLFSVCVCVCLCGFSTLLVLHQLFFFVFHTLLLLLSCRLHVVVEFFFFSL